MLSKCGLTLLSLLLVAIAPSIASGAGPQAASPPLKFVDSFKRGPHGGITQVFITPGGRTCLCDAGSQVSTWLFEGGKPPTLTGLDEILCVNTCRCDPATGRLERNGWFQYKSIARPTSMAMSADGRILVAVSKRKPEILRLPIPIPTVAFEGEPSHAQQFPNVGGFTAAALSPDGEYAYLASYEVSPAGDKSARFRIGAIQIVARRDGRWQTCATFRGENNCLDDVASLCCQTNGQRLFASCPRRNALVVLDREPKTGLLKLRQNLSNGAEGIRCLEGINNVDVSSDGRFLYTVAGYERGTNAVGVFRVQSSGDVSLVQQILNGEQGLKRFLGGHSIAVTSDGRHVYATATFSGRIACFDRDPASGRLRPRGSVEHLRPGQRILGPMGLAIHPNSRFVYVACSLEGSIAIFEIR